MNQVALSGRLAAEISEYTTQAGNLVVHFPLAVRKGFKKDEMGRYPVNYFYIEAWNALAESCKKSLSKGHLVNVIGRLDVNIYDDKNGQKRYSTMVVANNIEFLTPKQATMISAHALNSMADPENQQPIPEEDQSDESLFQQVMSADDGDIPF